MKKKKTDEYNSLDGEEIKEAQSSDALSEEELAVLKASIESAKIDRSKLPPHDTSDKATFFRFIKSNTLLAVASVIVAVAIVAGALTGSAFLVKSFIEHTRKYTIVIADEDPYTVDPKSAVIGDVLYVDMIRLADVVGLTVSGSDTERQFTSIKNGTYLLFENESEYVYINGGITRIEAVPLSGSRTVTAKAYVSESSCLVPYTFLTKVISEDTIIMKFDSETRTIYLKPKYTVYDGDLENRVMKELLFITDNFDVTIPEGDRPTYTYSYAIDISEYINSIDTEYLILVNKENSIETYAPSNLKELECPTTRSNLCLDYDAAVAVEAMMREMAAAGITETYVTSAYRSYAYQKNLYDGYVNDEMEKDGTISQEEAERRASVYSAKPGQSEHQTGLCLDFITADMGGNLNEEFENTEAFEWLRKNAYKYGFILRYPKDKVEVTGYQYEPWHYRFVGRQAASEIYFSGMCLEEYLAGQ